MVTGKFKKYLESDESFPQKSAALDNFIKILAKTHFLPLKMSDS
jgi:hypothetical protein